MIFRHDDDGPLGLLTFFQGDLEYLGRSQAVGDEGFRGIVPGNDVYLLAFHLVYDTLDSGAAHAHASPDAVHPGLEAHHGDLCPEAGLSGDLFHLDDAFGDFGHLQFEEAPDEFVAAP